MRRRRHIFRTQRQLHRRLALGRQIQSLGQHQIAVRFQKLEHFKAEVDRHADRLANGLAMPPELLVQLDKLASELAIKQLSAR